MEISNVVKVGGGVLGTGAVVGSAGYGVYEITNKENYKNLREKFKAEGKIVLKKQGETGYEENIASFTNESAWQLLARKYNDSNHRNQRFKDFLDPSGSETDIQGKLQEKCTSVLDAPGLENETAAITWCTRSSDFLKLPSGRPAASPPSDHS